MGTTGRGRGGFTVIELMLVVAIIAVLSAIIIPQAAGTGQKTKEAVLRGQLDQMRKAIEQFRSDCGHYPALLVQLQTQPPERQVGGTGAPLDVAYWGGPYLTTPDGGLPEDPFTGDSDSWIYDPTSGDVHSGSRLTSRAGEAYSAW